MNTKAFCLTVFVTLFGMSFAMIKPAVPLKDMNPIDACLFACNMCFAKEKVLLECANDVCLKTLGGGKPLNNKLWMAACPGLEMFFK